MWLLQMRNKELLNREEVIRMLQDSQGGKSQMVFAKDLGISQPLLSAIYGGSREIPDDVAAKFGLEPAEKFWTRKGRK